MMRSNTLMLLRNVCRPVRGRRPVAVSSYHSGRGSLAYKSAFLSWYSGLLGSNRCFALGLSKALSLQWHLLFCPGLCHNNRSPGNLSDLPELCPTGAASLHPCYSCSRNNAGFSAASWFPAHPPRFKAIPFSVAENDLSKQPWPSWARWPMPVISTLGRLRQEDQAFKVN